MHKLTQVVLGILLLIPIISSNAQTKKAKGYSVKEYLGQTNILDITLSPNGVFLVVVTMENNFDTNKEEYSLWRFILDEKGNPINKIKLTADTYRKSNLKWDKSGNSLFFLSKNERGRNLFKIDMDGGESIPVFNKQETANKLANYEVFGEHEILFNSNNCSRAHDENSLYEDVIYMSDKSACESSFYKLNYTNSSIDSIVTLKYPIYNFKVSPNNQKMIFVSEDALASDRKVNFLKFNKQDRFHSYLFDFTTNKIEKQLTDDGGYESGKWLDDNTLVFKNNGDPSKKEYNYLQGKLYEFNLTKSTYKHLGEEFEGAVSDFDTSEETILFTASSSTQLNLYEITKQQKVNQLTYFEGKMLDFSYSKEKDVYAFAVITKNSFPEI